MLTPSKYPRVFALNTECAICGRMYSAEERVSYGCDPNACSDWCLHRLPREVRTTYIVTPAGFIQWESNSDHSAEVSALG